MKNKNLKNSLYIIAGLMFLGAVIFKLKTNKQITVNKQYLNDKSSPIHVVVDTIQLSSSLSSNKFIGSFEAKQETKLGAEFPSTVVEIFVEMGTIVKQGSPLIQLDNSSIKIQLEALEIQIDGLKKDVERYSTLTQQDAIKTITLEKAKIGLEAALNQKNNLLNQLSKTTIKAPFSGVITASFCSVGTFAAPGMPLLQISDLSTLNFVIQVSENDILKFKTNSKFPIQIPSIHQSNVLGIVKMVGSKTNFGNSFPVYLELKNSSDFAIKAGMFGEIQISELNDSPGIWIDHSALIKRSKSPTVYLIKNNKAIIQSIEIAQPMGNKIRVQSGLKPKDVIIKTGTSLLFENASVVCH
jgi:membrane fusion protein, multidrug efflux system